jgi:hypothetical protein
VQVIKPVSLRRRYICTASIKHGQYKAYNAEVTHDSRSLKRYGYKGEARTALLKGTTESEDRTKLYCKKTAESEECTWARRVLLIMVAGVACVLVGRGGGVKLAL